MLGDIQIEEITEMMVHIYNCNKHTYCKYVVLPGSKLINIIISNLIITLKLYLCN